MSRRLLVGRDEERRKLSAALDTACTGSGRVVLLGGEPGIGKSALVGDLARTAASRDIPFHTGYCIDSPSPAPYGPWTEIAHFARQPEERRGGFIAGLTGEIDQPEIFQEIERLITSATPGRPVIITVEDIHWADRASLDLFWALARHIERMPMLLIATHRPLDHEVDEPFAQTLPEFHRLDRCERITLAALDLAALTTLAREQFRLNLADSGRLARYLLRYAGGNPFYTSELLATLEQQEFIREDRGDYEIGPLHEAVIPPIVQQLVQTRVARFDEPLLRTLQAAAILGERFERDHWLALAAGDEAGLERTRQIGLDAHILAPTLNSGSLAFAHALIRETLYQMIPPAELRSLHRRAADLLIAQPHPDPDTVAHHLRESDAPEALEWLIRAGARAYANHAWFIARQRYEEALAILGDRPEDLEQRAWLIYRLALTERWEIQDRAIEHLQEAEATARTLGDRLLEAYCAFFQGSIYWFEDDCARAKPLIDASVRLMEQVPTGGDVSRYATTLYGFEPQGDELATFNPIEGSVALIYAAGGWHREAKARADSFLTRYDGRPITDSTAAKTFGDAHGGLGLCYASAGEPEKAAAHYKRATEIYDQPNLIGAAFHQSLRTVILPYRTTDQDEFERQSAALHRIARSVDALFTFDSRLISDGIQHRELILKGDWEAARRSATTARDILGRSHGNDAEASLAELDRLQGDFDNAWAHLAKAMPHGPDKGPGTQRYTTGIYAPIVGANLAMDTGDLVLARTWIETHGRWVEWGESLLGAPEHHLLWARYHHLSGDPEQAMKCARDAVDIATDPLQPLALIAAHRLLGTLHREAETVEKAREHLGIARELAVQSRARHEQALVEIEQIALAIATGETTGISEQIESVREFLESIGAKPALDQLAALGGQLAAPLDLPTGFDALTAREIDVLQIVAAGLSNADVARRLSISPRTVTTHLSSIYRKLDTSSRTTITRIAIEHGLTTE